MSGKNGLTSIQQDVLTKIVGYGDSHGMSSEKIAIAVKAACIESTLGTKMKNVDPKSTATGVFGYTNPNWHDNHRELGDKNNTDLQIIAFYNDIDRYYERFEQLSEQTRNGINVGEYVYIKHHDGTNADDFSMIKDKGRWLWDSSLNAQLYNPAWIDEARSHNPATSELPDQFLNQIEPQTVMDVIVSGVAGGLAMEVIAEQLADLYLPQSAVLSAGEAGATLTQATTTTVDRQTLIDAWNHLLQDAGEVKLTQIDAVSQSENRIQFEFQNGDKVALTSHSSGAEVVQLSADDDFTSNWWNMDGSYGTNTQAADNSVSSTSYDADGNYTAYTDDGQGGITRNSYAPDGSFSTYTDNGLGNTSTSNYAADGSFSTYTDDGQGNIALNDYAPDGTPVDDTGVIADDNSRYDPDSGYAADNNTNQNSNDDTSWNT